MGSSCLKSHGVFEGPPRQEQTFVYSRTRCRRPTGTNLPPRKVIQKHRWRIRPLSVLAHLAGKRKAGRKPSPVPVLSSATPNTPKTSPRSSVARARTSFEETTRRSSVRLWDLRGQKIFNNPRCLFHPGLICPPASPKRQLQAPKQAAHGAAPVPPPAPTTAAGTWSMASGRRGPTQLKSKLEKKETILKGFVHSLRTSSEPYSYSYSYEASAVKHP